jgi:hypothetical protein
MLNELTHADLASRWGCSDRQVFRDVKRYGLKEARWQGAVKIYLLPDVLAMELVRAEAKSAAQHRTGAKIRKAWRTRKAAAPKNGHHVLTLAQAKRKAGVRK